MRIEEVVQSGISDHTLEVEPGISDHTLEVEPGISDHTFEVEPGISDHTLEVDEILYRLYAKHNQCNNEFIKN